jgi:hypothetical protein
MDRSGKLARANFVAEGLASYAEELGELCVSVESFFGWFGVSSAIAIVVGRFASCLGPIRGSSAGLPTLSRRAACNGILGTTPGSFQVPDCSKLWVCRILHIAKGGTAPTSESGCTLRGWDVKGICRGDNGFANRVLFDAKPSCQHRQHVGDAGGGKGKGGHRRKQCRYHGKSVCSVWRQ